jgi:hypothetical protein
VEGLAVVIGLRFCCAARGLSMRFVERLLTKP